MVNDFIRIFIEFHPQFHLDRQSAPNIPCLGIALGLVSQCAPIAGPPFKEEDIFQQYYFGHRLGIYVGGGIAVIENCLLIIAKDHIKVPASRGNR
tara:strand:+ start:273 stop:557 length:285 start_codon:yes stop_codon:yes gene_type:complete